MIAPIQQDKKPLDAPMPDNPRAAGISLAGLPELAIGRVLDVVAENDDATRLKAMGVCVGRRVQLVKLGDPLIIRAVGIRIGLSKRLAEQVLIEPVESSRLDKVHVGEVHATQ